jgi:hypothetical protein
VLIPFELLGNICFYWNHRLPGKYRTLLVYRSRLRSAMRVPTKLSKNEYGFISKAKPIKEFLVLQSNAEIFVSYNNAHQLAHFVCWTVCKLRIWRIATRSFSYMRNLQTAVVLNVMQE